MREWERDMACSSELAQGQSWDQRNWNGDEGGPGRVRAKLVAGDSQQRPQACQNAGDVAGGCVSARAHRVGSSQDRGERTRGRVRGQGSESSLGAWEHQYRT